MTNELGKRIEALLQEKGFNRTDLARAVGVAIQSAHQWVNGESVPKPRNLELIAKFLEVTPIYLQFGENQPKTTKDAISIAPAGELLSAALRAIETAAAEHTPAVTADRRAELMIIAHGAMAAGMSVEHLPVLSKQLLNLCQKSPH